LTDLPETIRLFPLPNVVLLPATTLPFHIFEPRYRRLVEDAWETNGLIGMIRFAPGWQVDYEGTPPLLATGCAGRLTDLTPLSDGRYNIELTGLARFDVVEEVPTAPYRTVRVTWRPEAGGATGTPEAARLLDLSRRLEEARGESADPPAPGDAPLGVVVNRVALSGRLDPEELQVLLEIDAPDQRAARLAAHLESRLSAQRRGEHFRRFSPDDPGVN
jgi:Lon protease-like protein